MPRDKEDASVLEKAQLSLRDNKAQWPLDPFTVAGMGRYGAVRKSADDGHCPDKPGATSPGSGYPCTHHGVDLSPVPGFVQSTVKAPHDGWILAKISGASLPAPFVGYEPGVVLLAHDDVSDDWWTRFKRQINRPLVADWIETVQSARYSLLGHLALTGPDLPMPTEVWDADDGHLWRKVDDKTTGKGQSLVMLSPMLAKLPKRYVYMGEELGNISQPANHVHWELRTSPLADATGRIDPIATFTQYYGLAGPAGSTVPTPSGGGGGAALLLLLLAAAGSGKKRGQRRARR